MKKLTRSHKNRILFGVCGGIGEYTGVDPVILRIVFVLLLFFSGFFPVLFVYLLSLLIVPKDENVVYQSNFKNIWFWLFLVFILTIFALPLIALLLFRTVITENVTDRIISTEEVYLEEFLDEHQIKNYLESAKIISKSDEGKLFSEFYYFGRNETNLYIWAYISEYLLDEDRGMQKKSAISLPLSLYYDDKFEAIGHIKPRDGSYYSQDVRTIFPPKYQGKILSFQQQKGDLIGRLSSSAETKAEEYFNNLNID